MSLHRPAGQVSHEGRGGPSRGRRPASAPAPMGRNWQTRAESLYNSTPPWRAAPPTRHAPDGTRERRVVVASGDGAKSLLRVVMFSGGRGSASISRSLIKNPSIELTNIINAYDDGL